MQARRPFSTGVGCILAIGISLVVPDDRAGNAAPSGSEPEPFLFSRNLVRNGSFEDGPAGWRRVWGKPTVVTGESRDGGHSLYLKDGGAFTTPFALFVPGPVSYRGWLKTKDVVVGKNAWNVAVVQVTGYDAGKKPKRHWDLVHAKGTTDWRPFSGTLDLSNQTDIRYLKLSCQIWNTTGEAWFDDIALGPPYAGPAVSADSSWPLKEARPFPPVPDRTVIVPQPQVSEWLAGEFVLDTATPVFVRRNVAEAAAHALQVWRETIEDKTGASPAEPAESWTGAWRPRAVHFCPTADLLTADRTPPAAGGLAETVRGAVPQTWESPPGKEGYVLLVLPQGVFVGADTDAGFLHAAQTLRQLVHPLRFGTATLPAVRVRDWPDLDWRGMYLSMCYGPGAGRGCDFGLLKRIVRNVLAGYKLNTLLLQVDSNMQYKSHPELRGRYTPAEMTAFTGYCNRYGVEVIPLVQSFGHNHYFVFGGGKLHTDLAEDDTTYSVCPSNPGSVKILTDIYDEIIAAFKPRYLHIGCDEVGPLGLCEKCKGTPKSVLFARHINALHDYLHSRGVGTMIWGDYLLDPQQFPGSSYCHGKDAWKAVELLRKDIVICDWHYKAGVGPDHQYPTTKALHDLGFPVVGVPAVYSRLNNASYAQYLHQLGIENMFSSVWASVQNWKGIKGHPAWMGHMICAAEYAWTTAVPALTSPAGYDATAQALQRLRPTTRSGIPGFIVDLKARANAPFTACADFPFGRHTLGGVRFRIVDPVDTDGNWCIGVGNGNDVAPMVTDLPVGRCARSLVFLQTCQPGPSTKWEAWKTLGTYEVVYDDNTMQPVPVVTDLTVAPFNQSRPRHLYGSERVPLPGGHVLYAHEWLNPHPDRPIHHVNVVCEPDSGVSVFLLALTGTIDKPADAETGISPIPGVADVWLEGFAEIIEASNRDGYFTYRGETAQSWYEYATTGKERVVWRTECVPTGGIGDRVTFVLACALGSGAGDCPHAVLVQGRDVLTIGTPDATDASWQGQKASAYFDYVTHDRWDSFGVLYLTVDADLLVPGQPARIEVRGSASGTKSWFMVHDFTDTIPCNIKRFGRGMSE